MSHRIQVPETIDQAAADKLIRDLAKSHNEIADQADALKEANQRLEERLASRPVRDAQVSRYADGDTVLLRGHEVTSKGQRISYGHDTDDQIVARHYGYLDDPEPKDELQRKIQELVDTRSIIQTIQKGKRSSSTSVKVGTPQIDAEILRLAKMAPEPIARAFVDAATVGAEWIPTDTLPELERAAKLYWEMMLPGAFPVRDIARNTTLPLVTNTFVPYQHEVSGDDPAQFVKSSLATSSMTTTLKTIAGRTQVGADAAEESLIPAIEEIRQQLAYALMAGLEDAMINGDTSATHGDTGFGSGNWNPGAFWPGNLSAGTNSHLRAFLGLRHNAIDNSNTVDRSTFSFATLLNDLANVAGPRMAQDYMLIGSKAGLAKNLYSATQFSTLNVFGAQASNVNGAFTQAAGIGKIYESVFATDDLNATGIFDNSTKDYTAAHIVNVNRWRIWRRYGIRLDMQMDITRGVWEMVVKSRLDFRPVVSSEKSVRSMIKMAKA
jgi:hypothetical protein